MNLRVAFLSGRLEELLETCRLNFLDLLLHEAQPIHIVPQFGQCVLRQPHTFRRTEGVKRFDSFAQFRIEVADTNETCARMGGWRDFVS